MKSIAFEKYFAEAVAITGHWRAENGGSWLGNIELSFRVFGDRAKWSVAGLSIPERVAVVLQAERFRDWLACNAERSVVSMLHGQFVGMLNGGVDPRVESDSYIRCLADYVILTEADLRVSDDSGLSLHGD